MYSITSFSIAACNSLRAPSRSNCSKNDLSSSSARLLSEITLLSGTWRILSFWRPRVRPPGLFLLLRGCAFSQLLIHNFRLYLGHCPQPALLGVRSGPRENQRDSHRTRAL